MRNVWLSGRPSIALRKRSASDDLPGVVEGVHEAQRTSARETTGCHVDREELGEFRLGVGLWEQSLDGVLESEVKRLSREVPDDVGHVPAPEGLEPLLAVHASEAVPDAGVTGDLSGLDAGVGILGLDDELHALDRCCARLGDGTANSSEGEVHKKVGLCLGFSHDAEGMRIRAKTLTLNGVGQQLFDGCLRRLEEESGRERAGRGFWRPRVALPRHEQAPQKNGHLNGMGNPGKRGYLSKGRRTAWVVCPVQCGLDAAK